MTAELSPAAQAVRDAVLATYADNIPKDDNLWALERASTVAALRAAADQVVPYEATAPWDELKCDYDGDHWEMRQWVRDQLLAIAAELEGQ